MANEDKKDFNAMLMDSKNMPKVQIITDEKSIEKYGGDKMYFAPPIDYDKVIRKREERKDRLHQNYLKRKASGAQKRYEDKIKGRKKAEIEAKKAAIRAEDIAKGVFVPVSSLPQREPMKGVQTA